MKKIYIYLLAVILLAIGYPVLHQAFGFDWQYFFVVVILLLATRMVAEKYGK